jgi:hypothetical protein
MKSQLVLMELGSKVRLGALYQGRLTLVRRGGYKQSVG